MLSLSAKAQFVLDNTDEGRSLGRIDRELVSAAIQPGGQQELSAGQLFDFEKLFEYVRQNLRAPESWLLGLEGLVLHENGEVRFEGRIVDQFNLKNGQISVQLEKLVREVLYPACLLAKSYGYDRLSIDRISFFINEVLNRFTLRTISAESFRQRQNETMPAASHEYGFLWGRQACQRGIEKLYQPFLRFGDDFFSCERFLSKNEFLKTDLPVWISFLPDEKKASVTAGLRECRVDS